MKRLLALCTVLALAAAAAAADKPKPNIVFFLVDDMGWGDCGVYGSKYYETPNIDRFAQRALRFTDAYALPLCSPTRGTLLSGQHSSRHGITSATGHQTPQPPGHKFLPESAAPNRAIIAPESKNYLEPSQYTIAECLRDAGYYTGHIGKWHLGLTEPYWPDKQGFQFALHAHPDPGPPSYFSPYGFKQFQSYPDGPAGEYIVDRFTDEAIKFITEHKDGPFFLNLWHHGVHGPWGHKEEYTREFMQKKDPTGRQGNAIMASMLRSIDQSFGRILEALDRLHLTENTLVIFNSDNGGNTHSNAPDDRKGTPTTGPRAAALNDWRKFAGDLPPTNNAPLRDGKASIYEGGVRVPLMWAGPGVAGAGTTTGAVVGAVDLYPTIVDLIELPRPAQQKLDGNSYAGVLTGKGPQERPPYFTFFPHGASPKSGGATVRLGDWKLLHLFETSPEHPALLELYNLRDDLGETKNLAEANPAKAKELDALVTAFLKDTGALVPVPNPAYKPGAGAAKAAAPGAESDEGTGPIVGWKLRKCTATVTPEGVRLEGGTRAPFIGTSKYRLKGPLQVHLRYRTAAGGPGEIQWRLSDQSDFEAKQVFKFDLPASPEWRETDIAVPVEGQSAQLRLFLPVDKGAIELSKVEVKSATRGAK